jgi:hypothetical protein
MRNLLGGNVVSPLNEAGGSETVGPQSVAEEYLSFLGC